MQIVVFHVQQLNIIEKQGEAVLTRTHNVCFEQNIKNLFFCIEIFNFYSLKNLCKVHGRILVMKATGLGLLFVCI